MEVIFLYVYLLVMGTAIGSFLNVLIDRLPAEESIMGRSHCDYCLRPLTALDLIPVISYLALKRRCRTCKKKLSWQYPAIEIFTGIIFVLTWIYAPVIADPSLFIIERLVYLTAVSALIVLFFADVKYQILPDSIQVTLVICSFILNALKFNLNGDMFLLNVPNLALAGLVVSAPVFFLFVFTIGRGMGFGDVKLAFTIGLLHGIWGGLLSLYVAFLGGGILGLLLIGFKLKKIKSKIAFGPFLIIGIIIVLFFGGPIIGWVKEMYGFV